MRRVLAVLLSLLLLAAAPGGSHAAPAARRAIPPRSSLPAQPAAAPQQWSTSAFSETFRDPHGDAPRRADIITATMRYRTRAIVFRAELRDAGSIKTANWRRGDTMLLWYLDTDSDGRENYAATVWNNGRDRLVGTTFDASGPTPLCRRTATKRGNVFTLRVPHRCITSPPRVRFQLAMFYDRSVSDTSDSSIVIDAAPGSRWASWVRRPRQPSKVILTGTAPKSMTYGGTISFPAELDGVYAGSNLTLHRRFEGSRQWERVAKAAVEYGDANFSLPARRPADYQVRFAGDQYRLPDRSRTVFVDVRMDVTSDLYAYPRPAGARMVVSGRVRPANPGGTIVLQRRQSGDWVTVARSKVSPENAYRLTTVPRRSGRFAYRVRAGGTHVVSAGSTVPVVVPIYKAKIRRVEPSDPVTEARNLNSEYISVVNNGRVPIDLTGWMVEANLTLWAGVPHDYEFTVLSPGDGVRIHTGSGTASAGHLYLGRSVPLWPEAGIARLYNPDDHLMHERQYGM